MEKLQAFGLGNAWWASSLSNLSVLIKELKEEHSGKNQWNIETKSDK